MSFCAAESDCTAWSDGAIWSSADENTAAILPPGAITNVVRSVKAWPISCPRVSFAPGGKIAAVFSSADDKIAPSDHAVKSLAAAQKLAAPKPKQK